LANQRLRRLSDEYGEPMFGDPDAGLIDGYA
jgi:hypothetical protein